MQPWIRFFVGTPRRFCITAGVIFVALVAIFPEAGERAIQNILSAFFGAIVPFERPAIGLFFIILAFAVLFGKVRPGKKGH
jgi:hypothetical protein